MLCIGNDVVDLKEPANAWKSKDLRFLKKILTDAEIEIVKNAENSDKMLWSLWACKETAYKIVKKNLPNSTFIPRRYQVIFNQFQFEYLEGKVVIEGKDGVFIRLFSNYDYVHCVGTDNLEKLDKVISEVEFLPKEENNPSLFLRICLARNLAKHYSLDVQRVKIERIKEKGDLLPPCAYIDGKRTDTDISLSHDGRFVAYAFY